MLQTVDDGLRERIRAALKAKGWDQGDLADKLDVSPAAISNMMKPGPRQIKFMPKLLEVLELEDYRQVLNESLTRMTAEEQAYFVGLAKSLTSKR